MARLTSPRFGVSYTNPATRDELADGPFDIAQVVLGLEKAAYYSQGTFANRPTSTGGSPGIQGRLYYATDRKLLYYDYGTGWEQVGLAEIGDNTVFNGLTPYDGREFVVIPDGTGSDFDVAWMFRWSSILVSWVYLGGAPILHELNAADTETASTYQDLLSGPTLTAPLTSRYDIEFGCRVSNSSVGAVSYVTPKIGASAGLDDDAVAVSSVGGAGAFDTVHRKINRTVIMGDVVKLQARVTAGTGTFSHRWLSMVPSMV
jgi:hypothetical protein